MSALHLLALVLLAALPAHAHAQAQPVESGTDTERLTPADEQQSQTMDDVPAQATPEDDAQGEDHLVDAEQAEPVRPVTWDNLVEYAGRFHPASVHFPIALVVAALLAELLGLCRRRWQAQAVFTARFSLLLAAATAIVAVILGWANAVKYADSTRMLDLVEGHRISGTLAGVLTVVAAGLSMAKVGSWLRWVYLPLLIATVALMLWTGSLGGAIVWGIDHYLW